MAKAIAPALKFEGYLDGQGVLARRLAALVAGILVALGQAPFDLYPIALIGILLAYLLARGDAGRRSAFWSGWFFGAGYFALALSWIVEPFLVDIARYGWMAPFALVGMSGGFGLFWGAAFYTARRIAPDPRYHWIAWATALTAAELARAYLLTGFPWAMISYIWVETPVRQLASITGSHGLTLLTLIAVTGAWKLARQFGPLPGALVLPVPVLALVGAALALGVRAAPPADDAPVVRIVQPNAPQRLKWDPAWIPVFFDRALKLTAAPADRAPDLVIWPETSVPDLLRYSDGAFAQMLSASNDRPVVAGVRRVEGAALYNSLVVLKPDAPIQIYDKYHLVPFGEYIPFASFLSRFGLRGLAAEDGAGFSPGTGPKLVDTGLAGAALPLICYEAIFPQDVGAAPARPGWLMQITNDAWFGKVSGPYQHLAQARMRAVEQGLPMLRAANTGISAVIDASGRVTASISLGQAGYVDAALPAPRPPTLYSRTGDWPIALVLFATLGALLMRAFAKSD